MSARVVDARFAGGPISVHTSELGHAIGQHVVDVQLPGYEVALFPDEARRLAVALIEQAARAEETDAEDWP